MEMSILVLGDAKSGKTAFLESLNAQLDEESNVYHLQFVTEDNDNIVFTCSESSNSEDILLNHKKYAGFILMFDSTDTGSYKFVRNICSELGASPLNKDKVKPIVLVGAKTDSPNIAIHGTSINKGIPSSSVFWISAKEQRHIQKPFLFLGKSILKLPRLIFVDAAPAIPDVNIAPVPAPIQPQAPSPCVVQRSERCPRLRERTPQRPLRCVAADDNKDVKKTAEMQPKRLIAIMLCRIVTLLWLLVYIYRRFS